MEERVVLTFDIGTQSMRGMFVDCKGNILDFEQIRYEKPYFSVNPGWAEQSADFSSFPLKENSVVEITVEEG